MTSNRRRSNEAGNHQGLYRGISNLRERPYDLYVPEDIQMYIAEISSSNVRELKSAVTKVISQITYFDNPDISLPTSAPCWKTTSRRVP